MKARETEVRQEKGEKKNPEKGGDLEVKVTLMNFFFSKSCVLFLFLLFTG